MKRDKKSNNIFSKPILPESLYFQEDQRQYKVGGVKIQGAWLKGKTPAIYRSSIRSALQLAELKAQIEVLKKDASQSPTNMFRMAEFKKGMQNFQLVDVSPTKKRITFQDLKINADNLVLQKFHTFWGLYQRKCKIIGKQIIAYSQKQKVQKSIDFKNYTIQIQQKSKINESSKDFIWPEKYNVRLFLHGDSLRSYCIYGQQKILKSILKKIRIQSIQITQIDFFKKLSDQFYQKLLTLFGNKLRSYEHITKQKYKNDLNIAFDLLQKTHLLQDANESQGQQQQKMSQKNLQYQDQSFINSQSSMRNANKININKSISMINSSNPSPSNSPLGSPLKSPPIQVNQSQFRIRSRRSTINYQQIDNEDSIAEYKVQDFNLQIKEVAYSDSDEEQGQSPTFPQNKQSQFLSFGGAETIKRKPSDVSSIMQMSIPQFMNEDSFSQSSSVQQKTKEKKQQSNIKHVQTLKAKFDIIQKQYTHLLYFAYFQDFISYHSPQLQLIIFQKVVPQIQYQNMKMPVCTAQSLSLKNNKQNLRLYQIQNNKLIKLSIFGSQIGVIYDNKIKQIKQQFTIDLSKVLYAVDQSQLLYIKQDNKIVCAGKLKFIISPENIDRKLWSQQTTIQFLYKYLIDQTYKKQDKYRFIDYKRRNQDVCQKWNNKIMKRIINKGDQIQFFKATFYGLSDSVHQKISNNTRFSKSLSRVQTKIESSSFFSSQCFALMQSQIIKTKIYDLRVFIKIDVLIDLVAQSRKNKHLQKRIDDICLFFSFKFGKSSVQKLMAVFTIQVLKKLQPLLLLLKNSKNIQCLIQQYFDVQYQIDDLMNSVSSYFT